MNCWNCVRSFSCLSQSTPFTIRNIVLPLQSTVICSEIPRAFSSSLVTNIWQPVAAWNLVGGVLPEECSLIRWYRALYFHIVGGSPDTAVGHRGQWIGNICSWKSLREICCFCTASQNSDMDNGYNWKATWLFNLSWVKQLPWPQKATWILPYRPRTFGSASLTKFRFFESNLDTLNALLHFTSSLCWEIQLIDPLIPSLMTWLHRSQVTKCCLVLGQSQRWAECHHYQRIM